MQGFDALAAEDGRVVGAVEVLHSVGMLLAQLLAQTLFVVVVEVKACGRQNLVLFNHLVQNVDVERQTFGAFEIFDELAAYGAANTVLVVELLNAVGAKGVSAVHEDARDPLSDVVLESAELANVEPTRLVVHIHDGGFILVCVHLKYILH